MLQHGDMRNWKLCKMKLGGMMNRKTLVSANLALLLMMLAACGMNSENKGREDSAVQNVVVNASVRKTGQYPEQFIVTISDEKDLTGMSLGGEDFHMTGNAGMWGSSDTRPFSAEFEQAEIDGNTLILTPKSFPEKFFYVRDFMVICDKDEALYFTEQDVSEIRTPVADNFETIGEDGDVLRYRLFTPEKKENMPAVVVFHGFGDTNNLLTYRTAVEWAEPENQKVRPCYVIAPVIDDKTYYSNRKPVFETLKALLDEMIRDGRVDPNSIYVMGNSFGGMSSIEFAELYPDTAAGVLALCPALNYSPEAVENLDKMKDVPIWFAHAANDNTIPAEESRKAVEKLKQLGAKDVHFTEYSDEEMNAAGADGNPDSTYSYHHVELAVMEDDAYMEWLYSR